MVNKKSLRQRTKQYQVETTKRIMPTKPTKDCEAFAKLIRDYINLIVNMYEMLRKLCNEAATQFAAEKTTSFQRLSWSMIIS